MDLQLVVANTFSFNRERKLAVMDGLFEFHESKGCTEIGCDNPGNVDMLGHLLGSGIGVQLL